MFEYPTALDLKEILPFGMFILFGIGFAGQMIYFWLIFRRLAYYKSNHEPAVEHPVSIVVCARNEYYNLKKNLPALLEQDYPDFEIIIVNDSSDDDSADLLDFYEKRYGNLKVVRLERNLNFFKGKKFPLSLGIKSARNEVVLLTDADCMPASNQWIRMMQSNFVPGIQVVLGYGAYEKGPGFLNKLIRYDTFHIAVQYLSYALAGRTYMGVGRNLSYFRSLFINEKGFSSHYKIASGDDDLFINKVASASNTAIEISKSSHTVSSAKSSFGSWTYQKKRHLVSSRLYKKKFKRLLGFYSLSKIFLYFGIIPLAILDYNLLVAGIMLVLALLSQLFVLKKCAEKLDEQDLLVYSFLLDVVMIFINPFIYFSNFLTQPDKWK